VPEYNLEEATDISFWEVLDEVLKAFEPSLKVLPKSETALAVIIAFHTIELGVEVQWEVSKETTPESARNFFVSETIPGGNACAGGAKRPEWLVRTCPLTHERG